MKVSTVFLIVAVVVFEVLSNKTTMAQQVSLTIRLGTFISVNCIPNTLGFSSDDFKTFAVDSLDITALGVFEVLIHSRRIDIKAGSAVERRGNKNFLFGNTRSIQGDMGIETVRGYGRIKFPLQYQGNTFVSITDL